MNEMIDTKLPTCYYLSPKPNTGFALGGFPKLTDGKNKAQEQTSGLVRMEDINIIVKLCFHLNLQFYFFPIQKKTCQKGSCPH